MCLNLGAKVSKHDDNDNNNNNNNIFKFKFISFGT